MVAALSAVQFPAHQGQAPSQAQRAAAMQSNRRLAQAAIPNNVGIASTDLGCDGCSGYDNRVQVSCHSAGFTLLFLSCLMLVLPPACMHKVMHRLMKANVTTKNGFVDWRLTVLWKQLHQDEVK